MPELPPPDDASPGPDAGPPPDEATGPEPGAEPSGPIDAALAGPAWHAGSSRRRRRAQADPDQREKRRRQRRRRRVRRVLVYGLGGLALLSVAWIAVTAVLARSQLTQARTELTALRSQLTAGDTDRARATAQSLVTHARHAERLTSGPAWATAAAVPYVGEPLHSVRGLTTQTSVLASRAVPGLIAVSEGINPRTVLSHDGTVDVAALSAAAAPVHTAMLAVTQARGRVDDLPRSTWLPFVDTARTSVGDQLHTYAKTLTTADQALQVLPTMLGADGTPRHYFIAFQNNAELRGTGGLPGAFAIATAVDGHVSIDRFESDNLLADAPSGLNFGTAYDQHYGPDTPYDQYVDSNVSPNFPYAAQIWCAMWQNVSGQRLDGALTVDPGALSYLLAATGPATAPDGTVVSSADVVSLLQKQAYAKYPEGDDNPARKQYILDIAAAAEKRILTGSGNPHGLLDGLARAVSERRVVAYSTDPKVEAVLAGAPIGGVVTRTTEPYSLLSINNGAAGKLDYYLRRQLSWTRTGCGATRHVQVTITLTNTAPASGLPLYVTERRDNPPYATVPGQNRPVVDYVATTGAQLLGVTVDGASSGAAVFDEEGHPAFRVAPEIKPGQTVTIVLQLAEPAGSQPVTVVEQPGVTPITVHTDDSSCAG